MNVIPVAIGAGVIAVVPPLRRRVVPVVTATVTGTGSTAIAAVAGAVAVTTAAFDGVREVGGALIHGPGAPAPGDQRETAD